MDKSKGYKFGFSAHVHLLCACRRSPQRDLLRAGDVFIVRPCRSHVPKEATGVNGHTALVHTTNKCLHRQRLQRVHSGGVRDRG